jgi:hypothetical protein
MGSQAAPATAAAEATSIARQCRPVERASGPPPPARSAAIKAAETPAATPPSEKRLATAHDVMVPFACVQPGDDLGDISRVLAESGLPQVPAVENGVIAGYVGETELARAYAREIAGEGSPPTAQR